jgi:phage gp36-like protein
MPYCTQSDLETLIPATELAELTSESGNNPDSAIIAEIIDRVSAEIDSYVSVRYAAPFLEVPDIIKGLTVDMVLFHLYSRRSAVPEIRRKKYEDAREFLHNIALGKSKILGLDGTEISMKSSRSAEITCSGRIFSRTNWGGY